MGEPTDIERELLLKQKFPNTYKWVEGLVEAFKNEQINPLFKTLAWTGARPAEMLALQWSDLDFVDREGRTALRKAGLRHRPSYQVRHSFASILTFKISKNKNGGGGENRTRVQRSRKASVYKV